MKHQHSDRGTMTVEEAAVVLGISRTLAYELAREGRLPTPVLRLGRRMVISRLALERVLEGGTDRAAGGDGDGR